MNKNIILSALQTQLATIKTAGIDHEKTVYEPAVAKLTAKIKAWFESNVIPGIHEIRITSDSLVIKPSDNNSYGNDITIDYRGRWASNGEGSYFDVSSYRMSIDSREDNSVALHYYNTMASVAHKFGNICTEYKTKWLPTIVKLNQEKEKMYSEIHNLDREISNCEREIATIEKQVYFKTGFECTLKPCTDYNASHDEGESVYTKTSKEHSIRAQYGRARWDYYYINSFKVLSFPKAKHGKVVLEYRGASDDKVRTAELNKQRYAEFIDSVYRWQTTEAAEKEAKVDEKIEKWSNKATA